MSSNDRKPYLTSTVLDQYLLNASADNLSCQIEMIAIIQTPDGYTYVSDRNKYVDGVFYEAKLKFPTISRTIGEWISNELEFSTLTLELNNSDGSYNKYLPSGASFNSWIGKTVEIKIGLRDVGTTYKTIFYGTVTEVAGVTRSTKSITIIARDSWDKLNVNFPTLTLSTGLFPYLENDKVGKMIPLVLGDWTYSANKAAVPGIVVNGNDPNVYEFFTQNVRCLISVNPLVSIDTSNIYLRRSSDFIPIPSSSIALVTAYGFEVIQDLSSFQIASENWKFSTGDEFFCQCVGGEGDNIIDQAQYILENYSGVVSGDYDSTWSLFASKGSVSSVKSRIWLQEPQPVVQYVLSLLEQVRLEAFVNRDRKLSISSLQFDDWIPDSSFIIKNWDVERDTFKPSLDERNNFNRSQAFYNYEPVVEDNALTTKFFKNQAAITQVGKAITKNLVFPNLYITADVETQLTEMLKLASGFCEQIDLTVTWRALLLDLGNFVRVNVQIGSTQFDYVPSIIRVINYNPEGIKLEMKLWSFQMFPFSTWNPGYAGIVSGELGTITAE